MDWLLSTRFGDGHDNHCKPSVVRKKPLKAVKSMLALSRWLSDHASPTA